MNLNNAERVVAELDAWIVILSRMPQTDPKGTCHLVGCVGKGVHGQEGPHARKGDPPLAIARAQVGIVERQLIGCPDDFQPYQERPFCIGFPEVRPATFGTGMIASCSLGLDDAWQEDVPALNPTVMAELVDRHKEKCSYRGAGLL